MQLTKKQESQIEKIGQKYQLDFIILHGSYVTGKKGPEPDVDIAIYRTGGIDFDEQLKIYMELSPIFAGLGELDLKTLHKKDPLLRYLTVKDGQLLYGDKTAYHNYQAYAYRSYFDASDLFAFRSNLVRKHIKEMERRFNVRY